MTYQDRELLRFSPFAFKNGDKPKTKYFIVLGHIDDKLLMACLPTSKDHVPADAIVERGCVDIPERCVNAFVFNPTDKVTETFTFPLPKFVYGEQVDEYEEKYLDEMDAEVEHLGQLEQSVFQDMKDCLKKAVLLRRKYRQLL